MMETTCLPACKLEESLQWKCQWTHHPHGNTEVVNTMLWGPFSSTGKMVRVHGIKTKSWIKRPAGGKRLEKREKIKPSAETCFIFYSFFIMYCLFSVTVELKKSWHLNHTTSRHVDMTAVIQDTKVLLPFPGTEGQDWQDPLEGKKRISGGA